MRVCLVESGAPEVGSEPVTVPGQPRRFRKNLYVLLGVLSAVIVVSAVVLLFFLPRGLGEVIPYGMNYTVGEQMTYNMVINMTSGGQTLSETGTLTIHILSFDGEDYTVNETMAIGFQGTSQQISFTMKMSKSGCITDFSGLPAQAQQTYSMFMGMPGFGGFFNKTEARVGETWRIPLNVGNSTFGMGGTVNYRFGDIENITVPAGTYETFKMEISTDSAYVSSGLTSISVNMNGQIRLEYGTCRLVDMNMQETMSTSGTGQSVSAAVTIQTKLIQHTRP